MIRIEGSEDELWVTELQEAYAREGGVPRPCSSPECRTQLPQFSQVPPRTYTVLVHRSAAAIQRFGKMLQRTIGYSHTLAPTLPPLQPTVRRRGLARGSGDYRRMLLECVKPATVFTRKAEPHPFAPRSYRNPKVQEQIS